MASPNLKKIKDIIKEFFEKTTFEVEVEILPQTDSALLVNIKTDEPQLFIGEGGQTLSDPVADAKAEERLWNAATGSRGRF